jgi:hypothetical protein
MSEGAIAAARNFAETSASHYGMLTPIDFGYNPVDEMSLQRTPLYGRRVVLF